MAPLFLAIAALTIGQPMPQASVRFHDGSTLKLTLVQDSVEVHTKYGRLTIPFVDIHAIDFGPHLSKEMEDQVPAYVRALSAENYKTRENASGFLLKLGPAAYPLIVGVARSDDLETKQRAIQLTKALEEKHPAERLKCTTDDVIHTRCMKITGRISSPSIKAKSAHLGDVLCRLEDLLDMKVAPVETTHVTIDAARHSDPHWLDSGLFVQRGLKLIGMADGQVDLWPQTPGQHVASAKGSTTTGKGGGFMAGALIGRVGENGKAFALGDRFEVVMEEQGNLFLQIVAAAWNSPSTGSYRVQLRVE